MPFRVIKEAEIRIAVVHSFYHSRQPSGENAVVESEVKALRRTGFDVELFAARTDEVGDLLFPLRAGFRVATGRGNNPLDAIRAFRPDVVHIHNLFPNFSRKWVEDIDVPLLHTIHNYRPLCANGVLFRDGHICTDCPDGKRWSGVRHACYRESRLATLPIAWANRNGAMADPLLSRADRLVVLSERQASIYSSAGVPEEKMSVRPNFLPEELDPGPELNDERQDWMFVGRLTEEKGILRLLEKWPPHYTLRIFGDGPLKQDVLRLASKKSVQQYGMTPRNEVINRMKRSVGLVVPSLSFETFGLIYFEALSAGLPVLAFEPNVVADMVKRDGTGSASLWTEDLALQLDELANQGEALNRHCRQVFEQIGTEKAFLKHARTLYSALVDRSLKKSHR